MKYILILFAATMVYLGGCNENRNTKDSDTETKEMVEETNDQTETTESEIEPGDVIGNVAQQACNCLKPLEDLQTQYQEGKIGVAEYMDGMKNITPNLGNCVTDMQEALSSEGDLSVAQRAVLDRMGEMCPAVSGVMFQGN